MAARAASRLGRLSGGSGKGAGCAASSATCFSAVSRYGKRHQARCGSSPTGMKCSNATYSPSRFSRTITKSVFSQRLPGTSDRAKRHAWQWIAMCFDPGQTALRHIPVERGAQRLQKRHYCGGDLWPDAAIVGSLGQAIEFQLAGFPRNSRRLFSGGRDRLQATRKQWYRGPQGRQEI